MIEEKTNILYMYDGQEEINNELFSKLKNDKFYIKKIRTFGDLKINFNHYSILFLNIENLDYYSSILNYISENKHNQKILTCFDRKDSFLLLESIENKVNDFIFYPINPTELTLKLEEFDRDLNFMTKVYKIRSLETKEIKKELIHFYKNDLIKIIENFNKFESVLKNILNSFKHEQYRIKLLTYFSDFIIQDIDERSSYIKEFALDMLYGSNHDRIEDNMIRPVIEEVIIEFKEIYGKEVWAENFIDQIRLFFELEIRFMGLNLKYEIQSRLKSKERELHSNSLHILMSSSSDKLNNYVSVIDSKCYVFNKLLNLPDETTDEKKLKLINVIKGKGKPLDDFKGFLNKQSKIFTTFKDEISNESYLKDLVFLIDFAYVNGMKVKYNNIKINFLLNFENEFEENIAINTNENMILASMYAVIENSIEANCKSIDIDLHRDNNYINIGIKNDGEEITEEVESKLFKKFFSTKNQYGLGLYTAKEWLSNINYKFEYDSKKKMFIISIPIINELK